MSLISTPKNNKNNFNFKTKTCLVKKNYKFSFFFETSNSKTKLNHKNKL